LLHVLPKGFHRIRHYGLLASAGCKINIARAKELMAAPIPEVDPPAAHATADPHATSDHHVQSSSVVSLLRRPHGHHRDLRAWRHTPRPATGRRRDQNLRT
jgi:hypothetical protein